MRIPKNIPLRVYIQRLIDADEVEKFYQTDDWKELKEDVLDYFHNECQGCLKHGKLTTSERYIEDGKERTAKLHVHHVNELRDRPDLALSRWYTDETGQRQANLIPLCKTCHNIVHEKLIKWAKKDKFVNEERW